MAVLAFDAVDLARGGKTIFEGLSLTLTERRIGVIGRNGSGKSQLLRLAAGLIAPNRGTVHIDCQEVARARKAALSLVGVVFQNPDHQIIFPTIGEELAFGLKAQGHKDVPARVAEILARFGWEGRQEVPVQTLSGGQKQLLCLMSVLAMAPKWVLLDEPMSGLDLATRYRLQAHLEAQDVQILHVTHELDALEGYERVLWLEAGRVIGEGRPEDLLPLYRAQMKADADALPDL